MSVNCFENNLEKYEDPLKYDELYNDYKEDLNYILECVKQETSPIIELACGTGRVTIPMAKRGLKMIGVDIHAGMLNLAKQKAEKENLNIHFEQQDCTKLNLPIKAPLIFMTGNSFQHFLTNDSQNELFQSVKSHLQPNGEFIFDTRNPILAELAIVEESEERYTNSHDQLVIEKHRETYHHHTQILHCTTTYDVVKDGQIIESKQDSISLRYTFPMELERILEEHGFELVQLYGSWKKDAYTKDSVSMIVHCRLG
ncbi:class I SAM-dependent methyltransferase [Neobacillus sp. SCS-31]|uniref:class I SAM-dependent methyltransferase n=1 Tax=Neobacillus oceani TaxID=3115292 RepID=UPI003906957B